MQCKVRRYEFDWLRVIAFSLLIFFHTGMLFVNWKWHIKNNEISNLIEWPMLFISQWRMSLIFLISGVGVYFSLGYRSIKIFIKDRVKRVLIPLLVGIFLLVAPQVYFERLTQGFNESYLVFFSSFLKFDPYPAGNFSWHHLWFLTYLFVYCLVLAPILLIIKKNKFDFGKISGWIILLLPTLWFGIGESLLSPLFPRTHALYNDWFVHFLYVSIFLIGFLIASSSNLQGNIKTLRIYSLVAACASTTFLYVLFWWSELGWDYLGRIVYQFLIASNRWFWVMAILGFSLKYLNKNSSSLKTINQLVYPFYILHQTIIIALGYYLRDLPWSILEKFCFISFSTFVICYIATRFCIMKINFLRVSFGMEAKRF